MEEPLRTLCVNTIKMLAVDAVEKANSGHPGMPMGCADIALEIWMGHLRYDAKDPGWPDRDRFVLSAGHGSMLLYAMLHLAGYDLPIEELKWFRQLGSKTPGHPELHFTPGVETTTGPLGQGLANAVGIAIASRMMQARFPEVVSAHRVFGICSDGDLMEGVSHESCSLAGHLGLDAIKFFYDDNHISIDGKTELALSDDPVKRFEAYGWFVQRIDGHDPKAIRAALDAMVNERGRPSMVVARTHIANGSPGKHDSEKAHGNPLGKEEVAATKKALGWPTEPTFFLPDEVRATFEKRAAELAPEVEAWRKKHAALPAHRKQAWTAHHEHQVPTDLVERLFAKAKEIATKPEATRALAGKIEQVAAAACPWIVGGSADLNPSTNTYIDGSPAVSRGEFAGRNIHYGVREHAMGSVGNGIAVHGGFAPFGSTFLIFSDYMRPPVRLAAIMEQQAFFVWTHDSVFLGEDGPTHQPVEQLGALRLIPNLRVVRPADAYECAAAWAYALERRKGPTALILTRQKLPPLEHANVDPRAMMRGAYRLVDAPNAQLVIIATGSEVHLAVEAAKSLVNDGVAARVVSAPCLEALEDAGSGAYEAVLPDDGLPRVSIEAARTTPWRAVVGRRGLTIGIDGYGASAPEKDIARHFGFTPEAVVSRIREWLPRTRGASGKSE